MLLCDVLYVHSFMAHMYLKKVRNGIRGVHAITNHIVLYYLVKTKKLAKHLYSEYAKALESTILIDRINEIDFLKESYDIAKKYDVERTKRERFTYSATKNAEKTNAKESLGTAKNFIDAIRGMMVSGKKTIYTNKSID